MPRTKTGSRRILFGHESINFRELADKSKTHTFNKWRRFANLTNPVLAHRCSRVLLELRALSCSGMVPFATLWVVFGQHKIRSARAIHQKPEVTDAHESFGEHVPLSSKKPLLCKSSDLMPGASPRKERAPFTEPVARNCPSAGSNTRCCGRSSTVHIERPLSVCRRLHAQERSLAPLWRREGVCRAGNSVALAVGPHRVHLVVVGGLRLETIDANAEIRIGMGRVQPDV